MKKTKKKIITENNSGRFQSYNNDADEGISIEAYDHVHFAQDNAEDAVKIVLALSKEIPGANKVLWKIHEALGKCSLLLDRFVSPTRSEGNEGTPEDIREAAKNASLAYSLAHGLKPETPLVKNLLRTLFMHVEDLKENISLFAKKTLFFEGNMKALPTSWETHPDELRDDEEDFDAVVGDDGVCPQCTGLGFHYDYEAEDDVDCDMCGGTGEAKPGRRVRFEQVVRALVKEELSRVLAAKSNKNRKK